MARRCIACQTLAIHCQPYDTGALLDAAGRCVRCARDGDLRSIEQAKAPVSPLPTPVRRAWWARIWPAAAVPAIIAAWLLLGGPARMPPPEKPLSLTITVEHGTPGLVLPHAPDATYQPCSPCPPVGWPLWIVALGWALAFVGWLGWYLQHQFDGLPWWPRAPKDPR